jgi:hypothetical protein
MTTDRLINILVTATCIEMMAADGTADLSPR